MRPTEHRLAAERLTLLALERLEDRLLLSSSAPTNDEQYMLELINQARANPESYAASLGISLNEGLADGTIASTAKPPLAFNPQLISAAQTHSQWMLDTDTFSHTGSGGSNPGSRMTAAGYSFTGSWTWGENIGYRGTTGSFDPTVYTRLIEEALFVDQGIAGRGHRKNLLHETFAEIGIGLRTGNFNGYNALMATQDFAKSGTAQYFTGVVYSDHVVGDRFYTPGEGLGGITIRAVRDGGGQIYSTTTWASGGFSLALPKGRYSVLVSGAGLASSQFHPVMRIGTVNRKLDFRNGVVRQAPEVAVLGNARSIIRGDTTPAAVDGTDFGSANVSGGSITRSFEIKNWGNATLQLTGTPKVVVTGPNAADFSVIVQPADSVAGDASTTFSIRFDPSAGGLRTAVIEFANNDGNENPFSFTISGTGAVSSGYQAFSSGAPSSLTLGPSAPLSPTSLQSLPVAGSLGSLSLGLFLGESAGDSSRARQATEGGVLPASNRPASSPAFGQPANFSPLDFSHYDVRDGLGRDALLRV